MTKPLRTCRLVPENEDERMAFRALLSDELHSDPGKFAEMAADWAVDIVKDLAAALTGMEPGATAGDNMILQHGAAMKVLDYWVKYVVGVEECVEFFDRPEHELWQQRMREIQK